MNGESCKLPFVKIDGQMILEYRSEGKASGYGSVFIHMGTSEENIYSGPAAFALYNTMKKFIQDRHAGSGDWFEVDTGHGKRWMERGRGGVHYERLEESA